VKVASATAFSLVSNRVSALFVSFQLIPFAFQDERSPSPD